jgi:hypothetical protein
MKQTPSHGFIHLQGTETAAENLMSCEAQEQVYFKVANEVKTQTQATFCVLTDETLLVKLNLN